MDQTVKDKIVIALNEWLDPKNPERSTAKLQAKSGVNVAYISNISNGKTMLSNTVIKDQYYRMIAESIGLDLGEGEVHINTKNFSLIEKVCAKAQQKKAIVLLDSIDSGLGKTYTLEYYASRNDKVVYIKCTSSMTAKDVMDEILAKLLIRDIPRGMKSKIDLIKDRVLAGGYLIIIDELEDVKLSVYKVIKEIIDFTQNRCALIVSGMGLIEKIEKLSKRNRPGFPQLKRRLFSNRITIQYMDAEEKISICEANNIHIKTAQNWFVNHVHDMQSFTQYLKDIHEYVSSEKKAGRNAIINGETLSELFNSL